MAVAHVLDYARLSPPTGRREGYMPYLDGLRGIAILLVILLHAGVPFIKGGWIGVDIFFVLSGYLITSLLMREHDRTGRINLWHFYMRRVLRLLPAVVVLLTVFSVVVYLKAGVWPFKSVGYVLFYVANWVRAFGWSIADPVSHCWSLSIEEQFYFIWPLLFMVMAMLRMPFRMMAWIAVAGVITCAAWRGWMQFHGVPPARIYFGLDTRADALLIGCTLALADIRLNPGRLLATLTIASLGLITYIAIDERMTAPWLLYGGYSLVGLASAVLIVELRDNPYAPLRKITTWTPLVNLGKISYGVYLWHFAIMTWMNPLVEGNPYRWPLKLFVGGGISLAIAILSYKLIEMPFLKLKSRFQ